MNKAEWISLVGAFGALLALIPAYHQFFASKNPKKAKSRAKDTTPKSQTDVPATPEPMGPFAKALGCVSIAALIFVIEIIAYSWLARLFGVSFNFSTMPQNWLIGFIALLLVPGILLLIGLAQFTGGFSD